VTGAGSSWNVIPEVLHSIIELSLECMQRQGRDRVDHGQIPQASRLGLAPALPHRFFIRMNPLFVKGLPHFAG